MHLPGYAFTRVYTAFTPKTPKHEYCRQPNYGADRRQQGFQPVYPS